ncbi:hypothetical protein C0995_012462 [Termitomyces sp. Mi166|nr:hypothetical protein C0995_012462 [Termitomyces sp. Mi166\
MAIKLEPTAPVMVPKTVIDSAPTPASATLLIQHTSSVPYVANPSSPPMHPSQWAPPCSKGKGKAKATKEDNDQEGEATQRLRKELENFVVLTKSFKKKKKAKALIADSEQMGAKQFFKSKEVVDSNSNEQEKERFCVIKKIKREHVKEPIGMSKGKEIIKLQKMVAPKMPMMGPSHQTLKPIVLIPSVSKSVPKPIVASATPVAGPSTV